MINSDNLDTEAGGSLASCFLSSGFLYAIRAGDRAVKFGIARSVERRLRILQIGSCDRLRLVAKIHIADELHVLERRVHLAFRRYRIRGEWFLLRPSTLQFAALIASGERSRIDDFLTGQIALSFEMDGIKPEIKSPAKLAADRLAVSYDDVLPR